MNESQEPSGANSVASQPLGMLELDRFCDRCGYNLRMQPVSRDEQTGILICRCPECGSFHAAGTATDAGRLWLGRLGTLLLLAWVAFLLSCFGGLLVLLAALPYGHLEAFTRYSRQQQVLTINGVSRPRTVYERSIRRPSPDPFYARQQENESRLILAMLVGGCLAGGAVAGTMVAVFLWHLRRPVQLLALLAPLGLALIDYAIWCAETTDLRGWGAGRLVFYALIECLGLYAGIRLGRPVVRGMLMVLLPESLLQHLSFLWHVDGRRVPGQGAKRRE